MLTTIQALRWAGSKRAEGWLGRRTVAANAEHMAEIAADLARALRDHRDVDANALLGRLVVKVDEAKRAPVFGGKARV